MLPEPLPLGPFLVAPEGRLSMRAAQAEPGFSFLWRGRRCAVRLLGGRVGFALPAARLPSTAAGPARREAGRFLLRSLARALPPGWRLTLMPDHRVQLETEQAMDWPATVTALIAPVVGLVIQAAPVLDLIDEVGLAPPPPPPPPLTPNPAGSSPARPAPS